MTTSHKVLGSWPNAPLALVVAQVRFEHHPEASPNLVAERIQKVTGGIYPNISPLLSISVVIGQAPPTTMPPSMDPAGFDLRNAESNEVVRLQQGSLTFMTSAYLDRSHFSNQWHSFMDALCEDRELRVIRLGIRYVDFIIPSDGHVPEDYFLDGLGRSPAALGNQSPVAFTLYDFARADGGQLRVQYSRGYGAPALPPDLQGSVLLPARLSSLPAGGISAMLDMDRWLMVNETLPVDRVSDALVALRSDISDSFQSIISPLADKEWKATTQGEKSC